LLSLSLSLPHSSLQICVEDDEAACRATFDAFDVDKSNSMDITELEMVIHAFLRMKLEIVRLLEPETHAGREGLSSTKQHEVSKAMARKHFESVGKPMSVSQKYSTISFTEYRDIYLHMVTGVPPSGAATAAGSSK
jgi:hypothetical protein